MERSELVPLDLANGTVARFIARSAASDGPGLLALRHALGRRLPGFWGDDPIAPSSLLFVREEDGVIEAFGLGAPEPAVGWLAGRAVSVALAAPAHWRQVAKARLHDVRCHDVITCVHDGPNNGAAASPGAVVRRLTPHDGAPFALAAPRWALRGWTTFDALIAHGAAFGVPHGDGFASLAWVFDETDRYDALAAYTAPPFRRLGLGRASAFALREHVRNVRGKVPLWSTPADNRASLALASSLEFVPRVMETILRWLTQTPVSVVERGEQFGMM